MIDRSETRDTPLRTVAFEVELLFGIHVAEPILASVHVRAQQQAGHMNASDPIKIIIRVLARRGPSTYVRSRSFAAALWGLPRTGWPIFEGAVIACC